jgi:hypothetical protein
MPESLKIPLAAVRKEIAGENVLLSLARGLRCDLRVPIAVPRMECFLGHAIQEPTDENIDLIGVRVGDGGLHADEVSPAIEDVIGRHFHRQVPIIHLCRQGQP